MYKDLYLRILRITGIEDNVDSHGQQYECYVEGVVDGELRKCQPLKVCLDGYESKSTVAGGIAWRVDENGLRRLQAHEPRVRLNVIKSDKRIGFIHIDLRNILFEQGSTVRSRQLLQHSPYKGCHVEFEVCMRSLDDLTSSSSSPSKANLNSPVQAVNLGVAIAEDHVLIGPKAEQDFILYITLLNASSLRNIVLKVENGSLFWIRYHIFGVQVDTEPFRSLKFAKFAPIRDSFQIRSNSRDVADFLQGTPVRVYLCTAVPPTEGGDVRKSEATFIASALVSFDALFRNEIEFVQATSNSAFPFETYYPLDLERDGNLPSIAVSLELHRKDENDGEKKQPFIAVEKATEESAIQTSPRNSELQQSFLSHTHSPARKERVSVTLRHFDLDPYDDDEEDGEHDYEGGKVAVSLQFKGTTVTSNGSFHRDEYGQLDQCTIEDVMLEGIAFDDLEELLVVCRDVTNDKVIASGRIDPRGGHTQLVQLLGPNSQVSGNATVNLSGRMGESPLQPHLTSPTLQTTNLASSSSDKVINYRMTVDLRSIKGLEGAYNVYLQYCYPLFTNHNVQTRPPILVNRFSERIIPHGLRLFQFQASRAELERRAQTEPFIVEMWHKDKYTSDKRLGFAALPLRKLIDSRPYFQWAGQTFATLRALELHREKILSQQTKSDSGLATSRRQADRVRKQLEIPIIQVQVAEDEVALCAFGEDGTSSVKRLASIKCSFTLETLGFVDTGSPPSRKSSPRKVKSVPVIDDTTGAPPPPQQQRQPEGPAEEEELLESRDVVGETREVIDEAWREFETWKETQIKQWQLEMQTREALRMSELEQEWARREHERAIALKQAQADFEQLQLRMNRAIADADRRERTLAQHKAELDSVAKQKMADLEILNRRAREECEHQIHIYKTKCSSFEGEIKRLRAALAQSEKRQLKAEEDFAAFKEKARQSNEASLQREIAQLQGANAELQSRLEQEKERTTQETMAKETIKAQLVQVARELERVRKEESLRAERQLDKLRLEYLAREERYVLDGDRQQLQDMRRELNELRAVSLREPYVMKESVVFQEMAREMKQEQGSNDLSKHVERLEKERDELLQTGLYEPGHPILEQLHRHIELARKNLL